MKFHRGARAAAVLSCGALAVLAFNGTASASAAGWDHVWTSDSGDVTVYVEEHGDRVRVCDTKADGYGPKVWVGPGNGETTRYSFTVTTGNGTCGERNASDGGKYDLPEGAKFTVTACAYGCLAKPFVNDH